MFVVSLINRLGKFASAFDLFLTHTCPFFVILLVDTSENPTGIRNFTKDIVKLEDIIKAKM